MIRINPRLNDWANKQVKEGKIILPPSSNNDRRKVVEINDKQVEIVYRKKRG